MAGKKRTAPETRIEVARGIVNRIGQIDREIHERQRDREAYRNALGPIFEWLAKNDPEAFDREPWLAHHAINTTEDALSPAAVAMLRERVYGKSPSLSEEVSQ